MYERHLHLGKYSTETEERRVHIVLRQNMVRIVRLLYKISKEESRIVEGFLAGWLPRHQFSYLHQMHELVCKRVIGK
jgi:hypothetical protein